MKVYQSVVDVCQCDKSSFKGLFANNSFSPYEIARNSKRCHKAIQISNPDYDIVIKRLHLYYDMKLVSLDINQERNLIVQFPVFTQPCIKQQLILYQFEMVPGSQDSYSFRVLDDSWIWIESIPKEYHITSLLGKTFLLPRQTCSLVYNVAISVNP